MAFHQLVCEFELDTTRLNVHNADGILFVIIIITKERAEFVYITVRLSFWYRKDHWAANHRARRERNFWSVVKVCAPNISGKSLIQKSPMKLSTARFCHDNFFSSLLPGRICSPFNLPLLWHAHSDWVRAQNWPSSVRWTSEPSRESVIEPQHKLSVRVCQCLSLKHNKHFESSNIVCILHLTCPPSVDAADAADDDAKLC